MTTRVATRSAGAIDGEGEVEPEAGGNVGRSMLGSGEPAVVSTEAFGSGPASTGALYVSSPAAISDTPVAVRTAGRNRFRSALASLDTGPTA
jgi:hypothetical protein